MRTSITYSRIKVAENLSLHAVEAGPADGQLVIFLHGFPEFWYGWRKQIDFFDAHGYRLLIPDQRGYNLSDKPRGISGYNIDHLASDVIALIDARQRERAIVVGHDWGGAIAWRVAHCYPERLDKLVVLNCPHPRILRNAVFRSAQQLRKSWYILFFQLPWLPEYLIARNGFGEGIRALKGSSRRGTFSAEELEKYRQAWAQPGAITAMLNYYRAILQRRPLRRPAGSGIRVPTRLLWGTGDMFLGRELAQPSIDLCENGKVVYFEGISHWIQHEEPDKVNRCIYQFIADEMERE